MMTYKMGDVKYYDDNSLLIITQPQTMTAKLWTLVWISVKAGLKLTLTRLRRLELT